MDADTASSGAPLKVITVYEETYCIPCNRTTIHEIFMSGTSGKRWVTVVRTCLKCLRAKGRVC